jgi:hypothetical protein
MLNIAAWNFLEGPVLAVCRHRNCLDSCFVKVCFAANSGLKI